MEICIYLTNVERIIIIKSDVANILKHRSKICEKVLFYLSFYLILLLLRKFLIYFKQNKLIKISRFK